MNFYIMSRGRAGKVKTWDNLPPKVKEHTYIVISEKEYAAYRDHYGHSALVVAPDHVVDYSTKFQWLMSEIIDGYSKCVILDDDLRFATREGEKLLAVATKDQQIKLEETLLSMEQHLDDVPLVSLHPRQMGHLAPLPYKENGKVICMQAINRDVCGGITVDRFPILADVALNLWVLSRGLGNRLLTDCVLDFGSCQAEGGCSITRTADMQRDAVEYYAAMYHPYFKVVRKKPKGENWLADEEGYRTDFRGQWKKLNEDAPNRR